jgi:hypothetical protein
MMAVPIIGPSSVLMPPMTVARIIVMVHFMEKLADGEIYPWNMKKTAPAIAAMQALMAKAKSFKLKMFIPEVDAASSLSRMAASPIPIFEASMILTIKTEASPIKMANQ